jgi:hypothetical protein
MQSLIFFNKEGDNLNFTYNQELERWEGDLLFHVNSDDTYKTIGLYTFEKISQFDYENVGNLTTRKFQLFNEYKFYFNGSSNFTQSITKIEVTNNDPTFYSKWIYGVDFESKFPKGTQIRFNGTLLEFTNQYQTYTVLATKKNAILIISSVNNRKFNQDYAFILEDPNTYTDQTISGINAIGFYNYLKPNLEDNFSSWSEPDFYTRFYNRRKLNIVNTKHNDGIVTIKNKDLLDRIFYNYTFNKVFLISDTTFTMRVTLKTESPKVFSGGLRSMGRRLYFIGEIPQILKPGAEFFIPDSVLNNYYIGVDSIPTFLGNNKLTYYDLESQVIWNNKIYECIQSYTWSATSSITPDNNEYWSYPRYLPTTLELFSEDLPFAEVHLSTNVFGYSQVFTQSSATTLAIIVEKHKDELKSFDIDLFYKNNNLQANGLLPTEFFKVEFFVSMFPNQDFSEKVTVYENNIEVSEKLVTETNVDTNENFKYNIIFTDLDDFGIQLKIGGQIYQQEIQWVYDIYQGPGLGVGGSSGFGIGLGNLEITSTTRRVNLPRTIDKTLRKWFEKWYLDLLITGINIKVRFRGTGDPTFFNSIILETVYPNVPLDFEVEVGDTANYFIEHSDVVFRSISNYVLIEINDRPYGITSSVTSGGYDTVDTLNRWVEEYSEELLDYGIEVENVSNTLMFRVKSQTQVFNYKISVGASSLPQQDLYIIIPKIFGKFGSLIASNEIVLPQANDLGLIEALKQLETVYNVTFTYITDDIKLLVVPVTILSGPSLSYILNEISNLIDVFFLQIDDTTYEVNYNPGSGSSGFGIGIGNLFTTDIEALRTDTTDTPTQTATWSFEDLPFSTGQVLGINNTVYPWNNQEYNLVTLEPQSIILDYRGPFWSTIETDCNVSPYLLAAFANSFETLNCLPISVPSDLGGEFTQKEYSTSFLLTFDLKNNYYGQEYPIEDNTDVQDIVYTSLNDCIYLLGNRLSVMDATSIEILQTIDLPSMVGPMQLEINPVNNYLYSLSTYGLHIIDTRLNEILSYFPHYRTLETPKKIKIDSSNGNVYLIYVNSNRVDVWASTNFDRVPTTQMTFGANIIDIEYNFDEQEIYIALESGEIKLINSQETFNFSGLIGPLFYEPSESSIYIFDIYGLSKINDNDYYSYTAVNGQSTNFFAFNNVLNHIVISQNTRLTTIDIDGNLVSNVNTNSIGPMVMNQYDGDIYQAAGDVLKVLDTINGRYKWTEQFSGSIKKLIFNPARNSVFGIIPSQSSVIERSSFLELQVTLSGKIDADIPSEDVQDNNLYGALDQTQSQRQSTWLKVREYIRKPRENFSDDVSVEYIWKWVDDQTPEFFLYDFSGDQLTSVGSYSYIGEKPLTRIQLNYSPNRDITKISNPELQQTVFSQIIKPIDYIDSYTDITSEAEPMEIFIGYNSQNEGPSKSTLKLFKREIVNMTISTTVTNYDILQFTTRTDGLVAINLNMNSDLNFITTDFGQKRGFKPGQLVQIFVSDITNTRNKYISFNNGLVFKLRYVFSKSLIGEPIDMNFTEEFTLIENYPRVGKKTSLSTKISVIDKEIGSFDVYGQTEIEDIRYKIELSNSGQLVSPEDTYIFKIYDINEQGIDWNFLNKKRKELMMVRDQIFSYIGSYKAIINAINYFGYNDLELYEYYRNVNTESKDFGKLFKVEIPDIFDNTVEGWTPNDFIKHTLPNSNYEDTNLFNLTFRITDKEGTNVLFYSLEEVLIKLQGLKIWLQKNVIPLTHRILDITGRADFVGLTTIQHKSYDTRIIKIKQDFSPFDFRLNEAYLMPVNSGSTVYTCVLDFSVSDESLASECFSLKIRTYETYKEWQPFKYYQKGEKVQYFQQIYESALDNNRLKNPRKFDFVDDWSPIKNYNLGDYASYYRDIYQYIGTQSSYSLYGSYSISPVTDIMTNQSLAKWIVMTEWKKSDYLPIQTLTEFRTGTHSYLFTVDSNLDPFIIVEVTSDNGYGQVYTNKKSYEIRGTKDLQDDAGRPDSMGSFNPIIYIKSEDINLKPLLTSEYMTIPSLSAGDQFNFMVYSDKEIVGWEIIDLQFTGCIIYPTIIRQSPVSARVFIRIDDLSQNGNFSFRIRGSVFGGEFGETQLLSGDVTSGYYYYRIGEVPLFGIGLSNLF